MNKKDFAKMSVSDIILYLINDFHTPVREFLEEKTSMVNAMTEKYKDEYPKVIFLKELFFQFEKQILKQMRKEEDVMFSIILEYEKSSESCKVEVFNSIIEKGLTLWGTQMQNEHMVFLHYLNSILDLFDTCSMNWKSVDGFNKMKKDFNDMKDVIEFNIWLENTYVYKKWDEIKEETLEYLMKSKGWK